MSVFAEVAVNVPGVEGVFDYRVPEALENKVEAGSLVTAPFGAQQVQGIVTQLKTESDITEMREITSLVDNRPVVNSLQMSCARWLSEVTLAPLSTCLGLMLPPGLGQQADTLFSLHSTEFKTSADMYSTQRELIALIKERGALRGRQLDALLKYRDWRAAARTLLQKGLLQTRAVLPDARVSRKTIRTAQFSAEPPSIEALGRGIPVQTRRQAALHFLRGEGAPVSVDWVYAASGATLADLKALEEKGFVVLGENEIWRDPLGNSHYPLEIPPELTPDQQNAWKSISDEMVKPNAEQRPILLRGVTGSGKTELYLRAAAQALANGKQVILLVPEIALTPQTVRRVAGRFPGRVGLIHSRLSEGERFDTWRRAREGLLDIIVGARSALFAPLPNLGLIVVDECHADAYFQSDSAPAYSAVETALALGRLAGCAVLLGSATPTVSQQFRAKREAWLLIDLPRRIVAHQAYLAALRAETQVTTAETSTANTTAAYLPLPEVRLVDMRKELKEGNRSLFSRALQRALENTLAAGQQVMLYLNRRGSSTFVFCRDCGAALRCPRCDLPLTWHKGDSMLVCHTCRYQRGMPRVCPQCNSERLREYGSGTEKVEALIKERFPQARVLRWDADTTRLKGAEDLLLSHFVHHRADILIGTQMLAKGLDLPLVTLVGVVLADAGLNFPDYRAAERTFEMLEQVSGRAGRSALGGRVIIQTFQPENYAIQSASVHDPAGFYATELEYRRKLHYPPFTRLALLETRDSDSNKAEQRAQQMVGEIQEQVNASEERAAQVLGPLPAFFARERGKYRWQVLLKSSQPQKLLRGLNLRDWRLEIDPPDVL